MKKLKTCPFCGSHARVTEWTPTASSISCFNCGAHFNTYDKEEAIEAWNSRHERTCKRVADEAYRYDDFECSECGWVVWGFLMEHEGEGVVSQPNYCPSCGAKIVEEQ